MTNRAKLILKIKEKLKGYEGAVITIIDENIPYPTIRVENGNMFIQFMPGCKESMISLEYAGETTLTGLLDDLNNPIEVEYKKKDKTDDAEI